PWLCLASFGWRWCFVGKPAYAVKPAQYLQILVGIHFYIFSPLQRRKPTRFFIRTEIIQPLRSVRRCTNPNGVTGHAIGMPLRTVLTTLPDCNTIISLLVGMD